MDREKIVKGLQDAEISLRGFANHFPPLREECHEQADACYDAIELLKKQEAVVRCKDCRKRNSWECWQYFFGRFNIPDEWFCADGEKDGDGDA